MDNFIPGHPDNVAHLIGHPRFQLVEYDVTILAFAREIIEQEEVPAGGG